MRHSAPGSLTIDTATVLVDQVDAECRIVAKWGTRSRKGYVTGILFQWTYMLRAVDVRGHWLSTDGKQSGIIRDGLRWQDGLTSDMFARDLSHFTKVISKTAKSHPEPMRFDLTDELKTRLLLLGAGGRIGPVIVSRLGQPYEQRAWGRNWTRLRTALKLPSELRMMDTRAGAITEAREMGADPFSIRDAAQHADIATADRYMRGRSESAAKVVKLRVGSH